MSLDETRRSIIVPATASFYKKLLAFSGPGYMVAVGYMDPGNWATDLTGGSQFGYALLFVILLSNIFAMLLQHLAVKLGIVTGHDLAQLCHDTFPKSVNIMLWLMAEIMIIACDLAEVIGTAIALGLLFHIPLTVGIILTAADVLVLLFLQKQGFRYIEAFITTLIGTVVLCFVLELWFAQPAIAPMVNGLLPTRELFHDRQMLLIAMGILGATVMPHNLYLHSGIVQIGTHDRSPKGKQEAIAFATIDSTIALTIACFVNIAILLLAAATFYMHGHRGIAEIGEAYKLLTPLLGVGAASTLFAVALLASGQNSTITATMAGQIILEGFLNIKMRPWVRRVLTRALAIVPAGCIALLYGGSGLTRLLILSQVVLSIQLPFAILPLVFFTSSKRRMGIFSNRTWLTATTLAIAVSIASLNIWLVYTIQWTIM